MVSISIPALLVKQRPQEFIAEPQFIKEYDFCIFSLSSHKLLSIAKFLGRKESFLGIQREHKEDRDREIGSFIASDHPFFPNSIIVNLPIDFCPEYYDEKKMRLNIDIPESSAYILDGQHRLKAFRSKHSKDIDLDLVVTAYFNLEIPTMAEIFTRINFFQKPVTKSLVYDLLEHNPDSAFDKYRDAHEVATLLNTKIGSPFYGKIKMLGIGSGSISQAAVVEAFSTRYKILQLMGDLKTEEAASVISRYYLAIKNDFKTTKIDPNFFFRTVGFNATASILSMILARYPGQINFIEYEKYVSTMTKIDLELDDILSFGGFKGVNSVVAIFQKALEEEGLL